MPTFLEMVKNNSITHQELTNFLFEELGIPLSEGRKDIFGVTLGELNVAAMRKRFERKMAKYVEWRAFLKNLKRLGLEGEKIERAKKLYALRENILIRPRDLTISEKKELLTLSRNFGDLLPVVMGLKPACNIDLLPRKGFGVAYIRNLLEHYGLHCETYYLRNDERWVAVVSYTDELVSEILSIKKEIVSSKITADDYDAFLGLIYGYPLEKIIQYIQRMRTGPTGRRFDSERRATIEIE